MLLGELLGADDDGMLLGELLSAGDCEGFNCECVVSSSSRAGGSADPSNGIGGAESDWMESI